MTTKILFVDDERPLLNAIERRLGDDFEITTADSGAKGLDALLTAGPFPVVFTDMRMPRMDGVEFTERARHIAPESTFIMLTGNQDQTTAVSALNRGRVFRFLNKPCDSEDLRNAIRDGLRQYELVTAERELMLKTFLGSVNILTDVLELAHPQIAGQVDDVGFKVNLLRLAGGIDDRWEFRLAARLALVGYSLLPDSKYQLLSQPAVSVMERDSVLEEAPQITGRLLRDVPRWKRCRSCLLYSPRVKERSPRYILPNRMRSSRLVRRCSGQVRIGISWQIKGRDVDSIVAELNSIMPGTSRADAACRSAILLSRIT